MEKRNIILICLDTVRKDFYDAHAPRLQDLAEVSFEQCRAASSWSVPSHASILTGNHPSVHGVHTYNRDFSSLEYTDTFLSDIPDHNTIGVSSNVFASPLFNFDKFFDSFSYVTPQRPFPEGLDPAEISQQKPDENAYINFLRQLITHPHPIKSLLNGCSGLEKKLVRGSRIPDLLDDGTNAVLQESRQSIELHKEPFFLFINIMEAHLPLQHTIHYDKSMHSAPNSWTSTEWNIWELIESPDKNEDYWKIRRELYSASIDYMDRLLAKFIRDIIDASERETSIIVTADHGENLGTREDEFFVDHTSSLTEGLLHVPFSIINPPDGYQNNEQELFSHLDLGGLVNSIAHNHPPKVSTNHISSEVIGKSGDLSPPENDEYWNRMIRCAYSGSEKYVWDSLDSRRKYKINIDEPNTQELLMKEVTIPSEMKSLFKENINEYKNRATKQKNANENKEPALEDRLRNLGYL